MSAAVTAPPPPSDTVADPLSGSSLRSLQARTASMSIVALAHKLRLHLAHSVRPAADHSCSSDDGLTPPAVSRPIVLMRRNSVLTDYNLQLFKQQQHQLQHQVLMHSAAGCIPLGKGVSSRQSDILQFVYSQAVADALDRHEATIASSATRASFKFARNEVTIERLPEIYDDMMLMRRLNKDRTARMARRMDNLYGGGGIRNRRADSLQQLSTRVSSRRSSTVTVRSTSDAGDTSLPTVITSSGTVSSRRSTQRL